MALLPVLGRVLREAGEMDRSEQMLTEAVERGAALGDSRIVTDAGLSLADLRLHRHAYSGVSRADVLGQVDLAILAFEELADEAGLARALTMAGKLRFWLGEAGSAIGYFERAASHSRLANDRSQEAESLQGIAGASHRGPTPVTEALARTAELRPRAELNPRLAVSLLATRAHLEAMGGQFTDARSLIRDATALANDNGLINMLDTHVLPASGFIELLAGNAPGAERILMEACEAMERIGELGFLSSVTPILIDALIEQGKDEAGFALSDRWHVDRLTIPEDADAQIGWRRTRARLLARRGDWTEAEMLGREAVAMAAKTDYLEDRSAAHDALAEVLELAGRPADSGVHRQEAMRFRNAKGIVAAPSEVRSAGNRGEHS